MSVSELVGGVIPPIATPLHDGRTVDVDSLLALADSLVRGGASGVFALGSTGEAVYLHDVARRQVVETLVSAHEQLPVIVGILETTAPRAVAAAANFEGLPVSAFVAAGPFFAKSSEAEIYDHFATIADNVPAPVLAYNIPSNVGYSLPLRVLARLIEDGTIVGIKDSSPDLTGLRELVTHPHPEGALYLTGSDVLFDCALAVGANGSVAGLANVAPKLFVRGLEAARAGDAAALAQVQGQINCLARLYRGTDPSAGINSAQIGSIKTALAILGVIASDQVSVPMRRSSAARRDYVASVLKEGGLLEPHYALRTLAGL
jgi:4-hydroxy-tetrahydrodipicolinate synthase